uniref:Uncharacterized protein n=2 Tax=Caenorhabditis japonica TaxID=281687 RepID=A0A8R1ETA7_CAEJA
MYDEIILRVVRAIYLSETVFSPGETLKLDEYPNELEISEKCGLKGALMLESIEVLIGEKQMLAKINEVVYNSKKGSYNSDTLYGLLNSTVDSDIFVSQLLHFWREHGGLPFMNVDRLGNSIKINQNGSNLTVKNGKYMYKNVYQQPPQVFTFQQIQLLKVLALGNECHFGRFHFNSQSSNCRFKSC